MFGKRKERVWQWSLLGDLLGGLRLLDALEFMDAAYGASPIEWVVIRERAARGCGLHEIAKDPAFETPPEVLQALEAGERDGRLPERLIELAARADTSGLLADEGEGVVPVVNRLLLDAVDQGAAALLLTRTPAGDGELKILRGEVWSPPSRYKAAECAELVRRIWILAGQPYWAPKPGLIRTRIPQGTVEMRVTPGREGGLGIEIVTVPATQP
jgi:hypothetical protein